MKPRARAPGREGPGPPPSLGKPLSAPAPPPLFPVSHDPQAPGQRPAIHARRGAFAPDPHHAAPGAGPGKTPHKLPPLHPLGPAPSAAPTRRTRLTAPRLARSDGDGGGEADCAAAATLRRRRPGPQAPCSGPSPARSTRVGGISPPRRGRRWAGPPCPGWWGETSQTGMGAAKLMVPRPTMRSPYGSSWRSETKCVERRMSAL